VINRVALSRDIDPTVHYIHSFWFGVAITSWYLVTSQLPFRARTLLYNKTEDENN